MDEILDEKTYEMREIKYAGFALRTVAFVADLVIFIMFSFGLYFMFWFFEPYSMFLKNYWWQILLIVSFYFIYFDGSESNATLGKQIMNIRILTKEKRNIDFIISTKHFFLSIILFFGYFILLFNKKKQTLADKICNVIVVKK